VKRDQEMSNDVIEDCGSSGNEKVFCVAIIYTEYNPEYVGGLYKPRP